LKPENITSKGPIFQTINNFLAVGQPGLDELDGTLDTLKSFLSKYIEEDEGDINIKIKFFEQSVIQLSKRFEPNLSTDQHVNFEIWLGQCFEKFGAWDKAINYYNTALKHLEDSKNDKLKIEILRSMGNVYANRNLWETAIDYCEQSMDLSRRIGDDVGEAQARNSFGTVYFECGQLDDALSAWEEGLEIAEGIDNNELLAQLSNNMGVLSSVKGDSEHALSYYTKCTTLFECLEDYRGLAETYHNLGMTYMDVQKYAEANQWFEKSFSLAKDIGDVRLQAMVKLNRVELYTLINDNYAGLALCNQALKTFIQLKDRLGEAETYKLMGVLYGRTDNQDLAQSYLNESARLAQKYKNPLLEAEVNFEQAVIHKNNSDMDTALGYFEMALPLFSQVNAEIDVEKTQKEIDTIINR
jgi:tetratricopeptide (TPR) repeat protein